MSSANKYTNYFQDHYKLSYSAETVETYKKWFYAQWIEILKHVKFSKNTKVLEIGSATGTLFSFLKDSKVTDYLGLELDNDAVKFSNKHFSNLFKNISIENLKTTKKFDYIFAFEVLEHVEDPDKVIEIIFNLLSENGYFIGTSPYPYAKNVLADKTHKYVLHPLSWKNLFLRNGFKIYDSYAMSFLPFIWRINKYLNIKMPFYIPFPGFISTTLIIAKK